MNNLSKIIYQELSIKNYQLNRSSTTKIINHIGYQLYKSSIIQIIGHIGHQLKIVNFRIIYLELSIKNSLLRITKSLFIKIYSLKVIQKLSKLFIKSCLLKVVYEEMSIIKSLIESCLLRIVY